MAEPKVSLLLQMVDKLTGPLGSVGKATQGFRTKLKSLGDEAAQLLSNRLIQGVGLYGLINQLGKAFEAADRFRVAQQKLDGTAKITGVSLDFLQGVAEDAAKNFGLSKVQASDFAVEMAKLATKAGDVGKAAPALQAFLDIGAARGLTAAETLKAVQQSILGIDEGTDKLFNANPSVLYAMYADAIGTTAGKLTDQQKAQALLNAAMEDGSKVLGQYSAWLETVAGKAQLAANRADEASAKFGESLETLRVGLADAKVWGADLLTGVVQFVQLVGEKIGYTFHRIPSEIRLLWESLMVGVASGVEALGKIIPFVGDKIEEAGRRMKAEHVVRGQETKAFLEQLTQYHAEAQADILGIDIAGQQKQTAVLSAGASDRTEVDEKAKKEAEKREKEHQKAMEKLEEEAHKRMIDLLPPMYQEYLAIKEQFDEAMLSQDAATQRRAEAAFRENHVRILESFAGLSKGITAKVQEIRPQLKGMSETWKDAVEKEMLPAGAKAADDWGRLLKKSADLGDGIRDQAAAILEFSKAVGTTNPELEQMIAGVGRLAGGLSDVAKAITPDGINFTGFLGGLTGAVLGLQGIVGSLFGESPAERARKELLRRNTEALDRLRSGVGDLMRSQLPGAKVAGFAGLSMDDVMGAAFKVGGGIDKAMLSRFLLSKGLSVGDMQQLAKDMGMELGEMQGGTAFRVSSVQAFFDALGLFEPGQFDQSFGGQTEFIDSLLATSGSTDPRERLNLITQALGGAGGSSALASLIQGADLSTAEGAANLRAQLTSWVQQANTPGGIDPTIFGGLTGSEFIQAIETVAGLLGELTFGVGGGSPGGGGTFSPPTGTAPVTISDSSATVLDAIAQHTKLSAEELVKIRQFIEAGNLGSITVERVEAGVGSGNDRLDSALAAINEALAADRDLSVAAGVTS